MIAGFCGSRAFGTVAFGTEGGLFDQSGIPAVVCGPGSMEQGHKPDEFISVEQLDSCDQMLKRVLAFASHS
ncbi:Acetylornithine deacetylase [Pseudomonas syringae pv. helianthi]|uniref:Acetylornithine deacetylase n=1 Tax=Pseudomonas syringae pv. helianthi TaxID=251654 RepID=A0A3M6CHL0_9PSED|nr:Acetylornithine deacetylase [Pseudomonas syringae pv. helianthi]